MVAVGLAVAYHFAHPAGELVQVPVIAAVMILWLCLLFLLRIIPASHWGPIRHIFRSALATLLANRSGQEMENRLDANGEWVKQSGVFRVPAKTQVFMFQWVTQRDARFFDQPLEFKPERWTEEFEAKLPRYAYFPFGGGPRACVGASFAMMEMILVLATIGQRFRLELVSDHPVQVYPAMSLRPKDGVKVVVAGR